MRERPGKPLWIFGFSQLGLLAGLALSLALTLAPSPAAAHRLKIFTTVEGLELSGYAFFIGGGRPQGVPFRVEDRAGGLLHQGLTDGAGGFRWQAPGVGDYQLVIDAGDGHGARLTIAADRFAAAPKAQTAAETTTAPPTAALALAPTAAAAPAPLSEAALQALIRSAVQHEMTPLLERIEAMDARLRLTDILSGLFLILGSAGGALWLAGRRRTP